MSTHGAGAEGLAAICFEAALDLAPHVDLTTIEVLPTMQVFGGSSIARTPTVTRETAHTT